MTMIKGKDLFTKKMFKAMDGKTYAIEFGFYNIAVLEEKYGGLQEVFDMLNTFTPKDLSYLFWAGTLTHSEEFEGMEEKQIYRLADKLIGSEKYMYAQLAVLDAFNSFWTIASDNKENLPDEYRKVLDEMEEQKNKAKGKKK